MTAAAPAKAKFRMAGGAQPLMLVPVQVNERGPYPFILDTGAGTSLLTPQLAASLEIQSTGSKQGHTAGGPVDVLLAVVETLALGDVRREQVDVAITDLAMIGRTVGAAVAGDLGYNFLKHFRLSIDFRALEIGLEDPLRVESFGPAPIAQIPIRLAQLSKPLILIEAFISGRGPYQFAIDTGTSTTAISPELSAQLGLETTPIGPATTGGAPVQLSAGQLDSVRVGRAERRGLTVIVGQFLEMLSAVCGTKLDGILGYNFLRNYKVVINYPNELFRLE